MKTTRNLTLIFILFVVFAVLSLNSTIPSKAETNTITIGPWIFDELAFADDATDISDLQKIFFRSPQDANLENFCSDPLNFEACLDLALTDYSPDTFLGNIGDTDHDIDSNWFQLDFNDIKAENNFGPDIVFFDCHYFDEDNSFEFALRPEGGVFTDFITYDASEFQETGVECDAPYTIWGVAINLSSFGLAGGTVVDALQFKALPEGKVNLPQGDPVMAAVLTTPPLNIFMPIVTR